MPGRHEPQLSDAELDQLARQWFADARAKKAKEPESKSREDAGSATGLLDLLFDGDEGSWDSDGSSD